MVTIGDLAADFILQIPFLPACAAEHQLAQSFRFEAGGSANVLIAGARLGLNMSAVGVVGDDLWGREVIEILQDEGVDVLGVRRLGTTTCVTVLVSQEGEHVFLGKYGTGPDITFGESDRAQITACDALFFSGYTLCESRLRDLTLASLSQASERSIPTFFDPGPHVDKASRSLVEQVLGHTRTLLLTEDELQLMPLEKPQLLLGRYPALEAVVVKRSAAGCSVWSRCEDDALPDRVDAPGFDIVAVDTSGAGDCFDAAWIAATLWGWEVSQRAQLANAVGAAKTMKLGGGRSAPTLAEIRELAPDLPFGE